MELLERINDFLTEARMSVPSKYRKLPMVYRDKQGTFLKKKAQKDVKQAAQDLRESLAASLLPKVVDPLFKMRQDMEPGDPSEQRLEALLKQARQLVQDGLALRKELIKGL